MTKTERRQRKDGDEIAVPNWIEWTVDDWTDFYQTIAAFNYRFRQRHKADSTPCEDKPPADCAR
jgi:hypothetical protein